MLAGELVPRTGVTGTTGSSRLAKGIAGLVLLAAVAIAVWV